MATNTPPPVKNTHHSQLPAVRTETMRPWPRRKHTNPRLRPLSNPLTGRCQRQETGYCNLRSDNRAQINCGLGSWSVDLPSPSTPSIHLGSQSEGAEGINFRPGFFSQSAARWTRDRHRVTSRTEYALRWTPQCPDWGFRFGICCLALRYINQQILMFL